MCTVQNYSLEEINRLRKISNTISISTLLITTTVVHSRVKPAPWHVMHNGLIYLIAYLLKMHISLSTARNTYSELPLPHVIPPT